MNKLCICEKIINWFITLAVILYHSTPHSQKLFAHQQVTETWKNIIPGQFSNRNQLQEGCALLRLQGDVFLWRCTLRYFYKNICCNSGERAAAAWNESAVTGSKKSKKKRELRSSTLPVPPATFCWHPAVPIWDEDQNIEEEPRLILAEDRHRNVFYILTSTSLLYCPAGFSNFSSYSKPPQHLSDH